MRTLRLQPKRDCPLAWVWNCVATEGNVLAAGALQQHMNIIKMKNEPSRQCYEPSHENKAQRVAQRVVLVFQHDCQVFRGWPRAEHLKTVSNNQ